MFQVCLKFFLNHFNFIFSALPPPPPQQQQQPYSPLSSQWPSSQQQPAIVTQSTQQPTQASSVLPRIRPLPPSQQSPSSSSLAASQHSPPNSLFNIFLTNLTFIFQLLHHSAGALFHLLQIF
jgi:hypothetical protein